MKLPGFLSKPRWQSKDADVRRLAVARDDDAELQVNLSRLAREDPDAGVRLAAMKRLADPGLAQGMAHDDPDAGTRAQARVVWLDLLAGTHPVAPPLAERLRLLKAQDDPALLEQVARLAPEAALREAALARVSRPALLFERALGDPDVELRLALIARIDDEALLERLAERARRSDKNVNRAARERIEALRIARGDTAAAEALAEDLCARLEGLLRHGGSLDEENAIAGDWQRLESAVGPTIGQRYRAARELLAASRRPAPAASAAPTAAQPEAEPSPAQAAAATDAVADDSAELVAARIAEARFAASLDEAKAEKQQRAARQRALQLELGEALAACAAAIEAGATAAADAAKARLDELRRDLEDLPPTLTARLVEVEARHTELKQWQHWAGSQRRREICTEIESLRGSGLHPDAVATKLREAQTEWKQLDERERRGARPDGLTRRFNSACRALIAPAEGYFKKREALRIARVDELETLLAKAADCDLSSAASSIAEEAAAAALPVGAGGACEADVLPPAPQRPATTPRARLASLRGELSGALRGLDGIDPRQRQAFARRIKEQLARIDAWLAQNDARIDAGKALLIGAAKALTEGGVQRGATAAVRELQQRWRALGGGRRSRDQAQWKEFRAALDAVFAGLDAERSARSAEVLRLQGEASELCARMEALASGEEIDRGSLAALRAQWDALRPRDGVLIARFEAARALLETRLDEAARARRHARFTTWEACYRLCLEAESDARAADALRARWQAAGGGGASEILRRRFEAALSGITPPVTANHGSAALDLVLEFEALAGIEAATEERERRRELQMQRLAKRMRGGGAESPAEALAALMERWLALGRGAEPAHEQRMLKALAAATARLP